MSSETTTIKNANEAVQKSNKEEKAATTIIATMWKESEYSWILGYTRTHTPIHICI